MPSGSVVFQSEMLRSAVSVLGDRLGMFSRNSRTSSTVRLLPETLITSWPAWPTQTRPPEPVYSATATPGKSTINWAPLNLVGSVCVEPSFLRKVSAFVFSKVKTTSDGAMARTAPAVLLMPVGMWTAAQSSDARRSPPRRCFRPGSTWSGWCPASSRAVRCPRGCRTRCGGR